MLIASESLNSHPSVEFLKVVDDYLGPQEISNPTYLSFRPSGDDWKTRGRSTKCIFIRWLKEHSASSSLQRSESLFLPNQVMIKLVVWGPVVWIPIGSPKMKWIGIPRGFPRYESQTTRKNHSQSPKWQVRQEWFHANTEVCHRSTSLLKRYPIIGVISLLMTARGPSCGDLDFFCWDATVERFNGWVVANPTLMGPTECSKISLFWEDVTGQVQAYDPQIPPSKKLPRVLVVTGILNPKIP